MTKCTHCNKLLKDAQYRNNNTLKSCPKCSQDDSQEHIYYPYPDAYGVSEPRSTKNHPEGPQSQCESCRWSTQQKFTPARCSSL